MEEIRIIGDKRYKVIRTNCTCRCHTNKHTKHIKACCDGGIVERIEEICSCNTNAATDEHTCPYAEEIHNDSETLCNCCDRCTQECCNDI